MHPQQFRITGFKDLGTPLQRSCINSQRRSLGARSAFGKRWVSIADLGSSAGKTLSERANGLRRWLGARGYGNARRVTTPGRSFAKGHDDLRREADLRLAALNDARSPHCSFGMQADERDRCHLKMLTVCRVSLVGRIQRSFRQKRRRS